VTQTLREIQSLMAAEGLTPHRRFGQNFLIDGNLLRKLVAAADLDDRCTVLEVGPGTGSLTGELLEQAGHVVAVEIDSGLIRVLQAQFANQPKLTLIHADALAGKHAIEPRVLEAVAESTRRLAGPFRAVANLPYNAGTPLLVELALLDDPPDRACITIQQEVADRICADAGSDDYGPLSIVLQTACDVKRIARVPPQAFWPAPNVTSVMLRFDRRRGLGATPAALRRLSSVVHAGFAHRRKTLRHNIAGLSNPDVIARLPAELKDAASKRPEEISPQAWRQLAAVLAAV
jgi:16S rRNA (adenine1518-N6/adenine1519-N6)-dimethyltransferase